MNSLVTTAFCGLRTKARPHSLPRRFCFPVWLCPFPLCQVDPHTALLLNDPQGERNVTANSGKVPIRGQQERTGVARRERNQAVVLESSQTHGFVIRKNLWQEPPYLTPAATPRRRVEWHQLTDQGLHAAAIGTRDAAQ